MPTLSMAAVRAKLTGAGASRKGLCNNPHPDPKYLEEVQEPVMEKVSGVISHKKDEHGIPMYETTMAPSVTCSRFADHKGDCSAFTFSISTPDTWPRPKAAK